MKKNNYNQRTYTNPYFDQKDKKTKQRQVSAGEWNWKNIFRFFSALIGLSFFVWFLIWSPIFAIKSIKIDGVADQEKNQIQSMVESRLFGKKFFILPSDNIFVFDRSQIKDDIAQTFNFQNVEVGKSINKITIKIASRQESAIWHEGDKYYYIDNEGNIVKEVQPSDIASSTILLIDNLGSGKVSDKRVLVDATKIKTAIQLNEEFKNSAHNLKVGRFIIDDDADTVKMKVEPGPSIYFNTANDIDTQITRLDILLKEQIKADLPQKTYIDLRYGETINYR